MKSVGSTFQTSGLVGEDVTVLLEDYYQNSIAEACGVTPPAIYNWIHKDGYYPDPGPFAYIQKLGLRTKSRETERIIHKDIERYIEGLKQIGITVNRWKK